MGFEDLVQVLIALAVLFGLFGGRKKRPSDRPQKTMPSVPVRAEPRAPQRPLDIEVDGAPEGFADEVYRILSGELERRREDAAGARGTRTEDVERSIPEEIRPAEKLSEVEAYSLETLEPAGEASHEAFHRTYDSPSPAKAPAARAPQRRRLTLDVRSARQAMLWTEILGPPKGMA